MKLIIFSFQKCDFTSLLKIKHYYFDVGENPANKRHALRDLRRGTAWTLLHLP